MKEYLPLMGGIALILIAHSLRSMERRVAELETWIKRHKAIFKGKDEA